MFIPRHFAITEQSVIDEFIHKESFGQLVSTHQGRLYTTAVAYLYSAETRTLTCHIGKANKQWQSIEGQEVLLTIQGPHDYISPTWYSEAEKVKHVPTWNYQIAQVYGKASTFTDPQRLANVVEGLSTQFESGSQSPWHGKYPQAMLNAIVGIQIDITEYQCQFKLSQNRSAEDQQSVIAALRAKNQYALADAMAEVLAESG